MQPPIFILPPGFTADPESLAVHEAAVELMSMTKFDYPTAVKCTLAMRRHSASKRKQTPPEEVSTTDTASHADLGAAELGAFIQLDEEIEDAVIICGGAAVPHH